MNKSILFSRNLFFLVFISLFCFACQNDDLVPNDEIIELKIFDANNKEITEIIGDGETIVNLEVTVPKNAGDNYRTVTFKKSGGVFTTSADASITKQLDHDGKVTVQLKVPLSNEPLFVSVEIGGTGKIFSDEKVIKLIGVDQIIGLKLLDGEGKELTGKIKADGRTTLLVQATVLNNTSVFRQVTFNVSSGAFQNNSSLETTKGINSKNEAIVSFKVPQEVGNLYFSSTVGSSSKYYDELVLALERAYADKLIIEPATISMDKAQPNSLKVVLTRNEGSVSIGTSASFEAFQTIAGVEKKVGRFTGLANSRTNSAGEINVNFYADTNDITADIPVTIRVKTQNDAGNDVVSTADLTIK
ncbi:hypothetical protein GKZ90_0022445 [Flavobacterium sp. MC2016-06]|jgi:hypothetical protein|uniref:hypothetical protein n=1 Tax=Flavobacterium sp. MC2016-06 TaxID=2676308 RepID=UPI0012BAA72B|nr:hypothetical protein [Flavobacterium sp. MC2016-06]MBU3861456.1 hypothetical protein [Flavobacterium sp. MC2016-06]